MSFKRGATRNSKGVVLSLCVWTESPYSAPVAVVRNGFRSRETAFIAS